MAEFQFAATLDESCRILQSILDRGDLYAVEKYIPDPQEAEHITQITEGMRSRWSELWGILPLPTELHRDWEWELPRRFVRGRPFDRLQPVPWEAGCPV